MERGLAITENRASCSGSGGKALWKQRDCHRRTAVLGRTWQFSVPNTGRSGAARPTPAAGASLAEPAAAGTPSPLLLPPRCPPRQPAGRPARRPPTPVPASAVLSAAGGEGGGGGPARPRRPAPGALLPPARPRFRFPGGAGRIGAARRAGNELGAGPLAGAALPAPGRPPEVAGAAAGPGGRGRARKRRAGGAIPFSASRASPRAWSVSRSMGSDHERPWAKVLPLSLLCTGLLLWCVFRERTEIDERLEAVFSGQTVDSLDVASKKQRSLAAAEGEMRTGARLAAKELPKVCWPSPGYKLHRHLNGKACFSSLSAALSCKLGAPCSVPLSVLVLA
ncbi:ubiquinol-cytochrome c reductase complex assembly factor 4 [Ciconia maguari]